MFLVCQPLGRNLAKCKGKAGGLCKRPASGCSSRGEGGQVRSESWHRSVERGAWVLGTGSPSFSGLWACRGKAVRPRERPAGARSASEPVTGAGQGVLGPGGFSGQSPSTPTRPPRRCRAPAGRGKQSSRRSSCARRPPAASGRVSATAGGAWVSLRAGSSGGWA